MTVSGDELAELASRPDVLRVSSDAIVKPHADVTGSVGTSSHLVHTLDCKTARGTARPSGWL